MRLALSEFDAAALEALEIQSRAIKSVFKDARFQPVEPPVLQPADIFLERSGEDIRRRLYTFVDQDGNELCLRPDLTIPTCRMYLGQNPKADKAARLCYNGMAYRFQKPRANAPSEFLQAGVELIGGRNAIDGDAEVASVIVEACRSAGLKDFAIQMGDLGLFEDLIGAIDVSREWRKRLSSHFWRPDRLAGLLNGQRPAAAADNDALLNMLAGLDEEQARAVLNDVFGLSGIAPVGGRSADEIAERLLAQAATSAASALPKEAVAVIRRYLKIDGAPKTAVKKLRDLAKGAGLKLELGIERLEKRFALMEQKGVPLKVARFSTVFGRTLEYYTGFVFEVVSAGERIAGGGRYDELLGELGAPRSAPAVGCAIRTERLLSAVRSGPK
jgi:ATP phosphoribosyltransferase regulatory subunit